MLIRWLVRGVGTGALPLQNRGFSENETALREEGDAIAHVLFSSITIEGRDRTISALALAPLAVTPQRQNQGIGSQLVEFGLSKCRELGHGIFVVVGEPDYYKRFGFYLPLCSLRSLWLNHSDATGNDIT